MMNWLYRLLKTDLYRFIYDEIYEHWISAKAVVCNVIQKHYLIQFSNENIPVTSLCGSHESVAFPFIVHENEYLISSVIKSVF